MKLFTYAALIGAFCSLGCDSPFDGGGYSQQRAHGQRSFCSQFTTCGTCTPVLGCGWCQAGSKGLCAEDPNACEGAESFSWSWESATCPGAVDGGARDGAVDATAAEHAGDAARSDGAAVGS
jgi:hypothetical protein